MLMTIDELAELTGYKSAKSQKAWLQDRGWRFELDRMGRPKVDREYYRAKMGNTPVPVAEIGPNWAAL